MNSENSKAHVKVPTAISVVLIIMGTLLLTVPAIFGMVQAGQESYVLANNSMRELPHRELAPLLKWSFLGIGVTMITSGVLFAKERSTI